jgi:hypothetical protein
VNSEDMGCAVAICFILLSTILIIVLWYNKQQYKDGYVQAIVDIEKKNPLKYQLIKQENGESIWVEK